MSMCRVTKIKAARKPAVCGECGIGIEVGQPYRWWKPRFGRRRVRCMNAPCSPKPWDLETNPLLAEHLQAADMVEDANACENAVDAATLLRDACEAVQGIIDQLQERLDNWSGTNLENTEQAAAVESSKDELEAWLSDAEGCADSLEEVGNPPDESSWERPDGLPEDYTYDDAFTDYETERDDKMPETLPDIDLGAYGPPRRKRARKTA